MKLVFGKKALALVTAACAASTSAVGFAAWYVSGPSEYSFSGNVQIEDVIGNIANVEIGEGQELQSVRYTAPEEAINSGTWLYSDTDVEECENLTLVYNFTFTGVTSSSAFTMAVSAVDSKSGVMFESQFGGATREASYSAAVEAGYIVDASEASIEVDLSANTGRGEISYSTLDGVFSFSGALEEYYATVTIQFSWGEIFGYENPYFTYVGLTDAEERAAAADTLDYIAACLEGVTYSITFEPIVNQG